MKKILISTAFIGGHQLEYLHHLYIGAVERPENEYVFLVPENFHKDSKALSWIPQVPNISFYIIKSTQTTNSRNIFKKAYYNVKILSFYIKKYQVTDVILISLMDYIPFLPFFVSKRVRVTGIIYRIYLYDWKKESILRKLKDALIITMYNRFKLFYKIMVLNDSPAAMYMNKYFKTDKYKYLPDPIPLLPTYRGCNIREELGISSSKTLLLHPGGMLPYKGSLNILKALDKLDMSCCDKIAVIFAGRAKAIQPTFDQMLVKIKNKVQVLYIEGYISFEKMADLFVSCDFVLIPYTTNNKSSGIVGNAAFYQKPVVVAKGGVIGKMVKKGKLGIMLESPTVDNIVDFLENIPAPSIIKSIYSENHSVKHFNNVLFD